jgi:hypothetical protein
MKRPCLPEPAFYSVASLARKWKTDADQLELYGAQGLLQIESVMLPDGREIRHVAREEAERFLAASQGTREDQSGQGDPDKVNPTERASMEYLIGIAAHLWAVGDAYHAESHYRIRDLFESDAQAQGLKMLRGRETDAKLIKRGIDLVRAMNARIGKPANAANTAIAQEDQAA